MPRYYDKRWLVESVTKLKAEGKSNRAAAAILNVSRSRIQQICAMFKLGWPHQDVANRR